MSRLKLEELAQLRAKIDAGTKEANREALNKYEQKRLPVCRVGIDPAFRVGGFSVCVIDENNEARFLNFKGRGMVGFVLWLLSDAPERAIATIENSNKTNKTFNSIYKNVRKGGKCVKVRKSIAHIQRESRNVGCNQSISETVVEFCEWKWGKKNVYGISPKEKGKKWPDSVFQGVVRANKHKLTGYTGKDDQRDSYQLAVRH